MDRENVVHHGEYLVAYVAWAYESCDINNLSQLFHFSTISTLDQIYQKINIWNN